MNITECGLFFYSINHYFTEKKHVLHVDVDTGKQQLI
jgi:hypothetical protein